MKIKMYLYPGYVSLGSAKAFSPQLFAFFKEQEVELEADYWNGTLETIPAEGAPVIVRASSMMKCSMKDLAEKCTDFGHFLFYDDCVILESGSYRGEILIKALNMFLYEVATHYKEKS